MKIHTGYGVMEVWDNYELFVKFRGERKREVYGKIATSYWSNCLHNHATKVCVIPIDQKRVCISYRYQSC